MYLLKNDKELNKINTMSYGNKINTIIHSVGDMDLVNNIYNTIVATTTTVVVVNGESITIPTGTSVDIIIRTLTGAASGLILLGSPKANYEADPNL